MAINQLLCEMCEILREHRCAILCKRQSLFFILLQFMVRMMLWLPWLPFSIWFKSLAQRGVPVEKIATLEDECHAYCLLTINSGSTQFQIHCYLRLRVLKNLAFKFLPKRLLLALDRLCPRKLLELHTVATHTKCSSVHHRDCNS